MRFVAARRLPHLSTAGAQLRCRQQVHTGSAAMSHAKHLHRDHRFLHLTLNGLKQAALATLALLIAACGSGGSAGVTGGSAGGPGTSACDASCGTAMVTITDAAGDFLSYTVDVTSLQLKKANGTVVET